MTPPWRENQMMKEAARGELKQWAHRNWSRGGVQRIASVEVPYAPQRMSSWTSRTWVLVDQFSLQCEGTESLCHKELLQQRDTRSRAPERLSLSTFRPPGSGGPALNHWLHLTHYNRRKFFLLRVAAHAFNPSIWKAERQVDCCEFGANLIYMVSSMPMKIFLANKKESFVLLLSKAPKPHIYWKLEA